MSWGTEFKADVFISRLKFDSKEQLQEHLEETQEYLTSNQNKIKMWAISEPKSVINLDEIDDTNIIGFVDNEIQDILNDISEEVEEIITLRLLLENWDSKKDV